MLETFHEKRAEVVLSLASLVTLSADVGAKSLGERVERDLVRKLQADRFHLVVVGEFNHGKTTFVNALLGQRVLPVGVTPTTAVIHNIEWAETPRAAVCFASGERKPLEFSEIGSFAVNSAASHDAVDSLVVGYPSALLEKGVVLVDTPGVNDLSRQRADITYEYIPKSDAVLFVVDAGQPVKDSERAFLQEKLLKQSRDKIVFVVAKKDIWDASEEAEAVAYVKGELGKLVKDPVVFAISAERALDGRAEESGMPELAAHLARFLAEERGRILLDNALGEGLSAGVMLKKGIDARRRAGSMSREELTRRIGLLEQDLAGQSRTIAERRAAIREEVAAVKAWVGRDLEHFTDDVIRQLPAVIDSASAEEVRMHLGAFLEKTFTAWAQQETGEIAAALETLAERTIALVREDARDTAKRLSETLGTDVRSPNVDVDTFGYDVGVVVLITLGLGMMFTNALLGGLLTIAAPVLAVYVKEKVEVETRRKAKELAPAAIREATSKIRPKLEEMIDGFAERLDAWVVTAGEELHREVIEVLAATRDARESVLPAAADADAACDELTARLGAVVAKMEGQRGALWAAPHEAA
jgi:small GTP-binding protein